MKTTEREWYDGPPPHIGWWNASFNESTDVWRWWNGRRWSVSVFREDSDRVVARNAALEDGASQLFGAIRWSNYWPEKARVPRTPPIEPM